MSRPRVFIGSSSEGLPVAEALQLNLDKECEVVLWSQGVFGLSQGTLESLVREMPKFDFAILVMTPDDLIEVRGQSGQIARDNVLFEIGLAIGILGRERTFAVYDRESDIRIPSDLAGISLATWQMHSSGDLETSLGATTARIKKEINKLGSRDGDGGESPGTAFLAVPMNAFNVAGHPEAYAGFRKSMLELIEAMKKAVGIHDVFCAIRDIDDPKKFDLPGASLAIDIEKIEQSEFFILVCIRDVVSKSVLIEMGMALALGKKCVIFAQSGSTMPYVLRNASAELHTVKTIEYETIEGLLDNVGKNGGWIFDFH